jgi:hypothetical protein
MSEAASDPSSDLSFEPDYEASRDPLRTFLRVKSALVMTPTDGVDEDDPIPEDYLRVVCISGQAIRTSACSWFRPVHHLTV